MNKVRNNNNNLVENNNNEKKDRFENDKESFILDLSEPQYLRPKKNDGNFVNIIDANPDAEDNKLENDLYLKTNKNERLIKKLDNENIIQVNKRNLLISC